MANQSSATSGTGLPIPYLTAVWAGMSHDDVMSGLKAGSILAPPGAPAGWLPDAITGAASVPGALAAVSSAEQPASAVSSRAKVSAWLSAIDPELAPATFDSIWQRAGADDASRASTLITYLAHALLGREIDAPDSRDASATEFAASTMKALDDFIAAPGHRATVVDLSDMAGADLAAIASRDIGYRHALFEMQPLALTGNRALFAASNADGHLDRFDPESGELLLSDAWVSDRSKFLAWDTAARAGGDLDIEGTEDWTFIDRGADGSGVPTRLELRSRVASPTAHQVVFGNGADDAIKGGAGTDRLYGAGGDDILRGAGGADHLEGGAGDDLLLGGIGNDELLGNQGADELEGGAGADRMAGGSGDDVLAGGRGNDRLDGGTGDDTYVIEAGDGTDTISDADGAGTIELDGVGVSGTMQRGNGHWASADGRVELAFDGDPQEGGTLTIKSFEPASDHSGTPAGVIEVRNWKNGHLGITLAGDLTADSPNPASAAAAENSVTESSADGNGVAPDSNGSASGGESAMSEAIAGGDASFSGNEAGSASSAAVDADGDTDGDASGDSPEGPSNNGVTGAGEGGGDETGADSGSDGGAAVAPFDFDAALDSLLGSSVPSAGALDTATLATAIEAFSGVLQAPDVTSRAASSAIDSIDTVSLAHVADALAFDVSSDDLEAEMASTTMPMPPELRQTEMLSVLYEKLSGVMGTGAAGRTT